MWTYSCGNTRYISHDDLQPERLAFIPATFRQRYIGRHIGYDPHYPWTCYAVRSPGCSHGGGDLPHVLGMTTTGWPDSAMHNKINIFSPSSLAHTSRILKWCSLIENGDVDAAASGTNTSHGSMRCRYGEHPGRRLVPKEMIWKYKYIIDRETPGWCKT